MAVIEMPTSGATVIYADAGNNGYVAHLDRTSATNLATSANRRDLRVMQALLEEALDNVRDALARTTGTDVTS